MFYKKAKAFSVVSKGIDPLIQSIIMISKKCGRFQNNFKMYIKKWQKLYNEGCDDKYEISDARSAKSEGFLLS
jgi:hypothetical protein